MRTAIVTGANRGIGLELCRQLKESGEYQVVGLCRDASDELKSFGVHVIENVETTNPESLNQTKEELQKKGIKSVDLLINNAGILVHDTLADLTYENINEQFAVNALGSLMVTRTFLDLMPSGAKIIMITSRLGSIGDNLSGGYYGYRASKAALNAIAKSLSIDLKPKGILVATIHPGSVRTDMTQQRGILPPDQSARGILDRVRELNSWRSGGFYHANGGVLPW